MNQYRAKFHGVDLTAVKDKRSSSPTVPGRFRAKPPKIEQHRVTILCDLPGEVLPILEKSYSNINGLKITPINE